jgi:hypothetical protein
MADAADRLIDTHPPSPAQAGFFIFLIITMSTDTLLRPEQYASGAPPQGTTVMLRPDNVVSNGFQRLVRYLQDNSDYALLGPPIDVVERDIDTLERMGVSLPVKMRQEFERLAADALRHHADLYRRRCEALLNLPNIPSSAPVIANTLSDASLLGHHEAWGCLDIFSKLQHKYHKIVAISPLREDVWKGKGPSRRQ